MKPKIFSSKAIVLAKQNYSETDRIITFLTFDYGKITVIAKGVRKTKSKKASVDVFSKIKFQAARGRNLDILSEAEIINQYSQIRLSLKRSSLAYYYMELINKIAQAEEINRELYDLTVRYLVNLNDGDGKLKVLRKEFVHDLFVLMGFWRQGMNMNNLDSIVENVLEREITSKRVGEIVLS